MLQSLRASAIPESFDKIDSALKRLRLIPSASILVPEKIIPPAQIIAMRWIAGEEGADEPGRDRADISKVILGKKASNGRASSVIRLPKVSRGDCAGSLRPAIHTAATARSDRAALLRRRDMVVNRLNYGIPILLLPD